MRKLLKSSIHSKETTSNKIIAEWTKFSKAAEKQDFKERTMKSLSRIMDMLVEEDKAVSPDSIGPCLETCLVNRVFFAVSELAQSGSQTFMPFALRFMTGLLKGVMNQDLFLHMEFHPSVLSLLLCIKIRLSEGYELPAVRIL